MDAIYPIFARADQVFYDHPSAAGQRDDVIFDAGFGNSPGWEHARDAVWVYWNPAHAELPEQGWKIHLSAVAEHAHELLRIVATYCRDHSLTFKHLATEAVFARSNGKDAARETSGKFVTIYPATDATLHQSLMDLGRLTESFDGPHILTDLRWHQGPVFVRYGGFRRLFAETSDGRVAAIRHPDGHLVEDVRRAEFRPPTWARIPLFLESLWTAARDTTPPPGFPRISGVVQFSNAGGVYTALDGGQEVILKESRPHAGLTADGRTARQRADTEAQALAAVHPASLLRRFDAFGHHFLVLDRVAGVPLQHAVAARHPLAHAEVRTAELDAYRSWAGAICDRVDEAVASMHEAGFTHGDLHPGNVLVDGDDDVHLIDFEMSRPLAEDAPIIMGVPGFVPDDGATGAAADLFAARRIRSFVYAPLTPLLDLHGGKAAEVAAWTRERFSLPGATSPSTPPRHAAGGLPERIEAIGHQLLADATPTRQDRLWPGDPAQFDEPSYALAHGALGPLMALHAAGFDIPERLLQWTETVVATAEVRVGLFDGLAGAAVALAELGRSDAAQATLERLLASALPWHSPGLYAGALGVGMAFLRLSEQNPELLSRAEAVFWEAANRANGWAGRSDASAATGAAGILRGPSGAAILAMGLYDRLGDGELLDLAENALRADLATCVDAADGSLQTNEGWRLLPYLGSGSAGVGHVLGDLLARCPTSDLRAFLDALRKAAEPEFVLEPGLFQGRAGLLLALAHGDDEGERAHSAKDVIEMHLGMLDLYGVPRPQGTGVPGSALLRLSCDLATGAAGVLWALSSLRDGKRLALPFLDLPPIRLSPFAGSPNERG